MHRILLILIVFAALVPGQQQIPRDPRYPAHWWTPIVDPKKPDWEILPQEAGPGEVILSKRNELGLLSNFAPTPFVFRGKRYASLEGFWQMMKYPEGPRDPRAKFPGLEWKYTREQVSQMVAFEAKQAGTLAEQNMTKMAITWVSFEGKHFEYKPAVPGQHYQLIVAATRAKENLYISYPTRIFDRGSRMILSRPSQFIEDISEDLLEPAALVDEERSRNWET